MKLEVNNQMRKEWDNLKSRFNDFPQNKDNYNIKSELKWKFWWTNPQEVLWLWATDNEEDYEGSQTQFGVTKDGTVVWAFFSHNSCFYYDEYEGNSKKFDKHDFKSYELEEVPKNILIKLKKRIELVKNILKSELKPGKLLFTKRLFLQKEFLKWAKNNNVSPEPMSVIGWLNTKYDFIETKTKSKRRNKK